MIAALWGDWQTSGSENPVEDVYISETTNSLTVRWQGDFFGGGPAINVSATINADGRVRLSYGSGNPSGGLIGISAGSGTQYLVSAFSQSGSMENAADIVFEPAGGLPEGLTCSASGLVSGTPIAAGTSLVTFVVHDFAAGTASREIELVIAPNPNLKPIIETNVPATGLVDVPESTSTTFRVTAADPEGSNLVYRWTLDGAPVGGNSTSHVVTTAWGDAGTKQLRCYVSDNLWSNLVFSEWTLNVLSDNDGDGIPNAVELANPAILDPWDSTDADEDPDNDFASNFEEYEAGTSYSDPDSDDDSLPDGWELRYGFDPLDAAGASPDRDIELLGTWLAGSDYYFSRLALVSSSHVYAASESWITGTGVLQVIDVSNPAAPSGGAFLTLPGTAGGIVTRGSYMDIGISYPNPGLVTLDAIAPAAPAFTSFTQTFNSIYGLATGSLYAAMGGQLSIFDTGAPDAPVRTFDLNTWPMSPNSVLKIGSYLYSTLADWNFFPYPTDLRVYEVVGGTSLVERASRVLPPAFGYHLGTWSNYLFAAGDFSDTAVSTVDISTPTNPTVVGQSNLRGIDRFVVRSNLLYGIGDDGVEVHRIDGPLTFTRTYSSGGFFRDISVRSNLIYALSWNGLHIYRDNGPLDTDADGIPDPWELQFFTNLTPNATSDSDGDGILDIGEFRAKLNPRVTDEDSDGLQDGAEVTTYGSRPDRLDTDGDGITDPEEVMGTLGHVTSPYLRDTDGDGSRDDIEYDLQTNPTNADPSGLSAIVGRIHWRDLDLAGAKVSFRGLNNTTYAEGVSSNNGIYGAILKYAGTYYVKVEMDDYADRWYPDADHRDLAAPFVITGITAMIGFDFELPPGQSPAYVEVESDPAGADVYLDFALAGTTTPARVDVGETRPRSRNPNLAPNMFSVRATNYPRPAQQSIEPVEAETRSLFFDLVTPSVGALKVRTPPGGGRVHIDAAEVFDGFSVIIVTNLAAGSHTIHIRKPGYLQPRPVLAWVESGLTNEVVVDLATNTLPSNAMDIRSVPPSASVHLDYVSSTSLTPVVVYGLDPASYTGPGWHSASHTYSLRRAGYRRSAPRYVTETTNGVGTNTVLLLAIPGEATDLDNDGLPDEWEDAYDLDARAPGKSGAADDADNDGHSNEEELNAGTNPLDPDSTLDVRPQGVPDGSLFTFRFATVPGRRYIVQCTETLTGAWTTISGVLLATGDEIVFTTTLPPGADDSFYRAIVLP